MIELRDENVMNFMGEVLYQKLTEGFHTRQLVNVTGLRMIGKTTALVRFAMERHLPIITHSMAMAEIMKENFGYDQVYSVGSDLLGRGIEAAVIDDLVSEYSVRDMGIEVATGYNSY